ncbi:putative MFS family arabinose efflux permease [Saccharopolyspora erythraea NRRL 2338]|nr:MFS transporter [Saccharopolyspora erythraea]EQD82704.1 major facilitator transporter [Saccharopolyspora erythraea D]PFG97088.1 putative MFS family arabinose efflux permease [Saccharopolyspora erythraea NRRL 2338]QRK87298.1 MFS transporter [Saccharopolyspora erythraea]
MTTHEGGRGGPTRATGPMIFILTLAMALPMLLLYAIGVLGPVLVSDLRISRSTLGSLTAVCFAVAAVLSLWAGQGVGRIGARNATIALFGVVALSFGLISVSTSFAMLVVGVALCGLAQALANPATNKVIALHVAPERRGSVVGAKQSGVQLAALVAGAALPTAAVLLGWRGALALVIPLSLVALAVSWSVIPGEQAAPRAAGWSKLVRPNAKLRWLMLYQLFLGAGLAAFTTFLPLYATEQLATGERQAALMIAGFGIAGIVARIGWTSLAGKLAEPHGLLLGLALAAAVFVGAVWASGWFGLLPAWIGSIGIGATAVAANAVCMLAVVRDRSYGQVTHASALASLAFFSGFVVSPPLVGAVADAAGGLGSAWPVLALELVLAGGCAVGLRRASVAVRAGDAR